MSFFGFSSRQSGYFRFHEKPKLRGLREKEFSMKNKLMPLLLLLLWAVFLGTTHLACFDLFEENAWYFYFIAIIAFFLQLLVLCLAGKKYGAKWFKVVCGGIYLVLTVAGLWALLSTSAVLHFPAAALSILCVCTDAFGLLVCLFLTIIPKKSVE